MLLDAEPKSEAVNCAMPSCSSAKSESWISLFANRGRALLSGLSGTTKRGDAELEAEAIGVHDSVDQTKNDTGRQESQFGRHQ